MSDTRIRRADGADLDAIWRIEQACFRPPLRVTRRVLRGSLRSPVQRVWTARTEEGIQGFLVAWMRPRTWRVYDVATEPGARHRGIGARLMAHAEAAARRAGARRMVLEADAENPRLLRWYEAQGYAASHRLRGYYAARRDAVRLEKDL
jgi:ribosomal-protein-alanine N-acetyltransferase